MGKSLGNVLEPRSLLKAYGADAVRFYFLKEIVFGQVAPPATSYRTVWTAPVLGPCLLPIFGQDACRGSISC